MGDNRCWCGREMLSRGAEPVLGAGGASRIGDYGLLFSNGFLVGVLDFSSGRAKTGKRAVLTRSKYEICLS